MTHGKATKRAGLVIIHKTSDEPLPYPAEEIRRQRARALAQLALLGRQATVQEPGHR